MYRLNRHLYLFFYLMLVTSVTFANTQGPIEAKKAREAHEKRALYTHFYQDETVNAYVNEVAQKLVANSDWPDYKFHFFVIDSPDINAFATYGGYIYIYRGLLSHLTSEAQLAAVLAHEIAHVTKRHIARTQTRQRAANVGAFLASIALWNGDIGDAIRLESQASISGFGRELELEADEYGADYLYRSGYDPNAIIEVLSILKDHQTFTQRQARDQGARPTTYHGVFSTHPRNDQRLKDVVKQAGNLPPGEAFVGRTKYREIVNDMVFGPNDNAIRPPGYERYSSKGLGVTFAYPEEWSLKTSGQDILLESADGVEMKLMVSKPEDLSSLAEDMLKARYQIEELASAEGVYPKDQADKEDALMGIAELEAGAKRVAVIKLGVYAYYFESASPGPISEETDQAVVSVIKSFRRAENADFPPSDIKNIYFHRLMPGESFAELAQDKALGRYTEDYLRLINGYYPSGEPQPGTWIKMAK